ncbi:hypothetical protein F4781DRAFT_425531 [Annulohypoxylon bovei var. microspora]|nr:hypothetical protein F4781DRAFT_425531 [Annulohypoxylon bovei var. microspora]
MAVEVVMNTPLADALNMAIQPKLVEVGWASGGADDSALSEYIILMLVNGKTQDQIAAELAGDLLSLGPDDPGARDFAKWLFDEIESLNSQLNGDPGQLDIASGDVSQNVIPPADQDAEMTMSVDGPELNAPTGPRSMRNVNPRGGREKRMLGQMAKAMDRSHDGVLHRVRANGNERINTHRTPPTGPRGGFGRGNTRMPNNRAAGFAAHLNQAVGNSMPPHMQGPPPAMNGMNDMSWMLPGAQDQLFQMIQQQNQMMQQMQQQLNQQNQPAGGRPNGRSLFDRVQSPRGGRRGGHANGHRPHQTDSASSNGAMADEDADMLQARRDPLNPDTTICKYNLACTNRECKFAHQSPAAPPNTAVDISDVCTYGAACKNRKCVGRHPSPATRRAHQIEQECKFFPNCTNMSCPFKHPDMPPCRNGGDCAVEGCKFTHLQTMCKYTPCTNRFCPYKHDEGQRGTFQDRVWTSGGGGGHVSERKFVDGNGLEELIVPGSDEMDALILLLRSAYRNTRHGVRTKISRSPTPRRLSSLAAQRTPLNPSIRRQSTRARTEKLPRAQSRTFAAARGWNSKRDIAVLGGGITGLTAAHYLARYAKNVHITLYEGSNRLGGWLHGDVLSVGDGKDDKVLFQRGPRMLRSGSTSTKYDDIILYDVIHNLKLEDKIRFPEREYKDRYLYYPDHLVKLPAPGFSLKRFLVMVESYLTEPIWDGALKSGLWTHRKVEAMSEDESIGDYFGRMFRDRRLVDNVLSGMIHGIYGGDIYKLSAKHSIFDSMWRWSKVPLRRTRDSTWIEAKDYFLFRDMKYCPNWPKITSMMEDALDSDIVAFDDGLVTLTNSLIEDLKTFRNVTIKTRSPITSLAYDPGKVSVTVKGEPPKRYDHVLSTIFSKHLASIASPAGSLPSLAATHAVTIMVVNLWFPNPDLLARNRGFGYLVPASTPGNDECLLGVLFDSDLQLSPDDLPGTKLTAMLGGHHWDGWPHLPTKEMAEAMALAAVRRHLGIDAREPAFASAKLCRDCLPQHLVGHGALMADAHEELLRTFKGRLSVAGPSYTGVGVMPAMRAAFDAAMRAGPDIVVDHVGKTGLDGFNVRDIYALVPTPKSHLFGRKWASLEIHEAIREEQER